MRDLRNHPERGPRAVCSIGIGLIGAAGLGVAGSALSANAQTSAANTAAQTQLSMYNQTRADLTPYMTGGNTAFSQLGALYTGGPGGGPNSQAMMTALTNTPGYQFGLQQGGQALDRSAASQGLLLSGAQQKASQQFGTNYAIQQAWTPYVNELNTMSTLGENAAAGLGAQGTAAANNAGTAQLAGGAAAGAGYQGITSGLGSALLSSQLGYGGGGGAYTGPGGGSVDTSFLGGP